MKGFLLFILLGIALSTQGNEVKNPLMDSDSVVWAGVDYSLARMIGPDDLTIPYNFGIPPGILIPGMFEEWNDMFLKERLDAVTTTLGKSALLDVNGVMERNRVFTTNQISLVPKVGNVLTESSISTVQIADEIRLLKLDRTNGLGLVFIVDKMVRCGATPTRDPRRLDSKETAFSSGAAIYLVFFDVASRKVIVCERRIHNVTGASNFRNFWFGPVKDMYSDLGKYRTKSSANTPGPPNRWNGH